jgi:hypothetical protein
MATKADFSQEEWQTLIQAPIAIGTLITLSSPALGDSLKESMAVAKKMAEAASATGNTELMNSLTEEYKDRASAKAAQIQPESRDPAAIKAQMIGIVERAAAEIDAKATPDEAAQLKAWLYSVGEAAAEAAKEGDFMGIGGEKVSKEEEAALAEIKAALNL